MLPFRSALRATRPATRTLFSQRFASSLVFLEHKGGKLNDSSLNAVTAASKVDGEVRNLYKLVQEAPSLRSDRGYPHWLESGDRRCCRRSQEVSAGYNAHVEHGLMNRIDGLSKIYTAADESYAHTIAESK